MLKQTINYLNENLITLLVYSVKKLTEYVDGTCVNEEVGLLCKEHSLCLLHMSHGQDGSQNQLV